MVDVERIRKKIGLTPIQMCQLLNVSKSTYENWKYTGKGHREVKGATATLFNLIEWLFDAGLLDQVLETLDIVRESDS